MPKLEDYQSNPYPSVLATGNSGAGKSTFIGHGPVPSAWLLVDKDTPTIVPGMDMSQIYFKTYPPAEVDLKKSDYLPPRNVADDLIDDITTIKNHFVSILRNKPQPLKMRLMDGTIEEWPTPRMVVLEGAATAASQSMNRLLNMQNKHSIDDFKNKFQGYDIRLQFLTHFFDIFLRLPCIKCVSTWGEEDSKTEKVDGKVEIIKTGITQPRFGGQLNDLMPGKFDTSLYFFTKNGMYYARTQDDDKHQGFKIGNVLGIPPIIPMTIGKRKDAKGVETFVNPCADLWKLLLKEAK